MKCVGKKKKNHTIRCVLCKRNVYFHNEHIQYIIFEHKKCNMHSNYSNVQYKSYCILKYKKKMVTKLWSNLWWSLSRQCDESFFQTHRWYERKKLNSYEPDDFTESLSPKKVQKDVTAFKYVHDWHYSSHILYSVNGVSNFVKTAKELWSFTFQKAQMSLKCWQPWRMN